jgi:hypothetical protein
MIEPRIEATPYFSEGALMDPRLANLAQLMTRAPWWVWLLLAVLVISGVMRLRPRSLPLARIVIVPSVFLVWGLGALGLRLADQPTLALPWLAAALLGSVLGAWTVPAGIRADREHRRIHVPGTPAPLMASLTVFVLKYACNVAAVLRPDDRALIAVIDMAVSGASAGYFWSGLVRMLLRYRSTPAVKPEGGPGTVTVSA